MAPSSDANGQLYRTIARNLPDGSVWLFDGARRCLVAEGPLAEEVRRVHGALEDRPVEELFAPEMMAVILPRLERALSGEPASYETEYQGRIIWSNYSPLGRQEGQARVMVIAFDVTERHRTEQALRESEQRYATLFANRTIAIAHCSVVTDAAGHPVDYRYEKINHAYEAAVGMDGAAVEGHLATELFPAIEHDANDFIGRYGRVALEGGDDRFEAYFASVDKWFSVYAYSARRGEFTTLFTDITAQKRAEAERERLIKELGTSVADANRNRAQLEATFDAIGEGISVSDPLGRVVLVNRTQARINGYANPDDMLRGLDYYAGLYEFSLPSGEPVPVSDWPVSRVLRGESVVDLELLGRRRDTGRRWYFRFSGQPVYDGERRLALAVVVTRDITERKRIERAREASERRLQQAVSIAHLGFWEWEPLRNEVFFSAEWKRQLGYAADELPNRFEEWESRLHPEDRERVLGRLALHLANPDGDYHVEFRLRHRDGGYRWIVAQALTEVGNDGQATRLIGIHLDITELKLAEQGVRVAAQHDALTGLPNRSLIFEYAGYLLAAAKRSHGGGAFLFIDLDRFKSINDLYGHDTGDQVLREVAQRLKACVREEDLVGRLGGDEFIIVLQHLGVGRRAATVARHVIDSFSRPFEIGELSLSLSPSIGISHFPLHGDDVHALINAADLAMYQAKHAGRANFQFYRPDIERRAADSVSIEAKLRHALANNGLALHYQPVIDMKTRRTVSAEALLRLTGADAAIGPDRFVPVAEAVGLIGPIGEWVLGEACRQHAAWRNQGLPPVSIAVNVSPLQFRQRAFAQKLRDIVERCGVAPSWLQIEVTESTVMDSVDDAVKILDDIKRLGIKVALDDFGTGYSSLSHLSILPIDKLKVDQSFVKRVRSERSSRAITDTIIALGRTLNLEVVGEGIESDEVLDYLRARNCDQAQGFLISRPLPAADFADWFRESEAHYA